MVTQVRAEALAQMAMSCTVAAVSYHTYMWGQGASLETQNKLYAWRCATRTHVVVWGLWYGQLVGVLTRRGLQLALPVHALDVRAAVGVQLSHLTCGAA